MRETGEGKIARPHSLTLEGRERAVITGVEEVGSFNEQMVILVTTSGALTLLGDNLHIEKLNLDDGQLLVEGRIAALEYDDKVRGARGGLMARLLK